jgi:dihydroflavonol-4-reductase
VAEAEQKTVLVTGGSGFLGSWCAVELLRQGYDVRTTVRDLAREPEVRAAIGREVEVGGRLEVLPADLLSDEGWEAAAKGCSHILHVASPFPRAQPKDPDELIVPAREGTLRVLRAGLDAGVERVVVTSSVAAIGGGANPDDGPLDESAWTNLDHAGLTPYARSKTIAEQAAWRLVDERGASERLAVVNPGAILGPVLTAGRSSSLQVVERLLGGMPAVPRIGFSLVDVRDVAALEVKAMTAPEAAGERFIAVSKFLWMSEVAEGLRERLGEDGAKIPKRKMPDLLVRLAGVFDPGIRSVVGQLGRDQVYSNAKARERLDWTPRPPLDSATDAAQSLIADPA